MKKVLESMAIAALAVLAASCAKESNVEQEKGTKELHFVVKTAANAPVKSYLENEYDGTYTPKWSKGDAMAIFIGDITSSTKKATATLYNTSDNQSIATFEGNVNVAGEGYFKGITPAERFTNGLSPEENGECVAVNLGDSESEYVQRPAIDRIDESCDILVSKPTHYSSEGSAVNVDDVYFKRVMSVVKVVVNGPESLKAEKIHSLILTSSKSTLSGRAKVDVTNAKVVDWTVSRKYLSAVYSDEKEMPVVYDADNVLNTVFYVANPTTLESGTTLTVSGETDNYTISKEITLQNNIVFPESQIAVINLSLGESNFVAKTSGSTYTLYEDELEDGDYLIVYDGKAMKALVSSGRLDYSTVTIEENQIENTDKSIVWHVAKSGDYWTIYNVDKKQYAAGTGVKSKAQLLSDGTDDKSLWSVSGTKTYEFVNKANASNNVNAYLRGNGTSGFACYSTSTGGALSLYRLEGPVVPKYEIVCEAVSEGGKISASAAKAAEGKEITLTATPETGYVFDGWSVKDEGGNEIIVAYDKFTMPAAKVIVSGSFSKIEYKITKADAVGGSFTVKVNGAEAVAAYYKDEVSLEATAEEGYDFSSWTVTYKGGTTDKTISTKGVFTMPAADVTVKATFTEKAKIPVYASLAELVAAGAPTSTEQFVTVTLSDEVITKLYVVGQYTNGVYFNVGSQEVLIYCKDTPTEWKVGGSVSGTLTNCKWVLYKGTWELCPDDYSELTCVSPCETPVITLNGAEATITCATEGATIHYTVDGTDPTSSSQVYTTAVTLTDGQTIKAIAVKDGMKDSAVASVTYAAGVKVLYTLNPAKGSNSSYTGNCDVTVGEITWNVGGNSQMVPWRFGGKSITKTDRILYSKTAYPKALTSIKVSFGSANSITVNSCKLVYSTNADFNDSKECDITFKASSTVEVKADFPANAYYKVVFNVTVSVNSNKYVELSKIEFLGLEN